MTTDATLAGARRPRVLPRAGSLWLLAALAIAAAVAAPLAVLVAAWLGLAFSAYLQYRALVTVEATCVWCLASAVTMGLVTGVATARFVLAPPT